MAGLATFNFKITQLYPGSGRYHLNTRANPDCSNYGASLGARVGGSYVEGAIFDPRTLIALLNIFRVHYNFFGARPCASPFGKTGGAEDPPKVIPPALRIPGTNEQINLAPRARAQPRAKDPGEAARHECLREAAQRRSGRPEPASGYLSRLYAGTKVGAEFDRSWSWKIEPQDDSQAARLALAAE